MPALLGLVFSRTGAIVGLCLLVAGVFGVQALRLAHANARGDRAEASASVAAAQLATCRGSKAELQAALDRQKAAVTTLQRQGAAAQAVNAKAATAARAVAERLRQHAAEILSASRGRLDACTAADQLILKEAAR